MAKINPHAKVKNLTDNEISTLQNTINSFETEGNLRTRIRLAKNEKLFFMGTCKRKREIEIWSGKNKGSAFP